MKKFIITLANLLIITSLLAQAPQAFKYQTVVRNSSNQIIPNQAVGLKISILQGSATGTPVYIETHSTTTNILGIANLEIGNGTLVSGNFLTISWGTNSYFVKIELDPAGGTAYQLMGTSQLVSVPYALHAKTAETVSFTEMDPVYGASPASGITSGNITNWNNAFGWGNHATAGYAPAVHIHSAADITSGTLPVARGGTGAATFSSGNVLIGNGTGAVTTLSRSGIDTRASFPPDAHTHPAADITSGVLNIARIPTGTTGSTVALGDHTHAQYLTAETDPTWSGAANTTSAIGRTGNVGIGTTSPSAQLHTTGSVRFQGAGIPGAGKVLTSDVNGNAIWLDPLSSLTGSGETNKLAFWNGTTSLSSNSNLHWDNSNNRLGIGTNSPVAELNVQRNNTSTNSQVWLKQLGTGDATLGFSIGSTQDWAMGIDQSDGNKFKISPHYDASTNPVLTLQTDGRIGQGTTSPTAAFHILKSSLAAGNHFFRAEYTGTGTVDPVGLSVQCNPTGQSGYGYGAIIFAGFKGVDVNVYAGTPTFSTFAHDAWIEGAGSGTKYGGYFYAYGATGNTGILYSIYSTTGGAGATKYAGYFSGNVTVTGTFSNPSDKSLKKNIVSITGATEKIKNLPVYSYEYENIEGMNLPAGEQFGFLAQDMENILPELVSTQKHPIEDLAKKEDSQYLEYKGINYIGLIPVLTKAVQEQQQVIELLQKQITILQQQINEINQKDN
jgi:hypothetical protein